MQQAPPSCPTPGHLRAHNSKPTSGHPKVKILNRPLDTENVKPKNRSEQPLDAETSVATERHQAKAPSFAHQTCTWPAGSRSREFLTSIKKPKPAGHTHTIIEFANLVIKTMHGAWATARLLYFHEFCGSSTICFEVRKNMIFGELFWSPC